MPRIIALAGLALATTLGIAASAGAQDTGATRPRSGPAINPSPLGAMSSPQRFLVTSSANDRGTFLWVIDAVEHNVTLCEKPAAAAEFTCNKKPLP